ncbi:hypothetical protein CY34DRAFT_812802 [Suillus luteus UH-Slu-Lm8-n1]|uniref:F-box domain-containing protein n=1 Tax=Suillus luteus UH-Slu-Lm8-n1 TaxID=930992 RepID=A0A0D0ARM9_9AGAM|nr:hypothetical protein CY34DRAFT_812802 [Suillus luteus UH-Slu-Lm8-n1]
MKAKVGFLSLAEELKFYILSFLHSRDILRCTSVCKALRQTYMSSSELQYIIELSGQRLLLVPDVVDHTSISKRLQLLRDKAHTWFKLNLHSFKTVSLPRDLSSTHISIAGGHICLWKFNQNLAAIIPILSKPSRLQIKRNWSRGTLCSVPHSEILDVFMDPAQNLLAVSYVVTGGPLQSHKTVHVDLRALHDDSVHPQAAGRTLVLSGLPKFNTGYAKLKGFGRHIALLARQYDSPIASPISPERMWQLQIWDWKNSTASNCVLSNTFLDLRHEFDISFLGHNRLLVVTDDLKLYSIEDMSQTPQLMACFLLPFPLPDLGCPLPMDDSDIQHSSEPQKQAPQTMYTSDPKHQLLCITLSFCTQVFIISTRIFFDLDGIAGTPPIPWKCWGPSNTRIFKHAGPCSAYVSGNRVLQAFPIHKPYTHYVLHVMDFSPLAVANRRGLGQVVKESSTVVIGPSGESLTTSLPYVDVELDRKFGSGFVDLEGIWADQDGIYLLNANWQCRTETDILSDTPRSRWLEVIGV